RELFGPLWEEHGVVFDRGNGEPVAPRTVEALMARRVKRLGLPKLSPHGLRHTHATVLLSDGAPVHAVQQRLGHGSAQITLNVYAHVLPGSERTIAERFAAALPPVKRAG
ncbi:MAG TPA: site-specific integrase, partial [Candidatus Saccharimonadales bacterium]|nr:site-specific integrase [Candidatus Saccharimonadales bacterium]